MKFNDMLGRRIVLAYSYMWCGDIICHYDPSFPIVLPLSSFTSRESDKFNFYFKILSTLRTTFIIFLRAFISSGLCVHPSSLRVIMNNGCHTYHFPFVFLFYNKTILGSWLQKFTPLGDHEVSI